MSRCYDFPELVLHDPDGTCGRYQEGGVCHPLPASEAPPDVARAYEEVVARGYLSGRPIVARGVTESPDGEVFK